LTFFPMISSKVNCNQRISGQSKSFEPQKNHGLASGGPSSGIRNGITSAADPNLSEPVPSVVSSASPGRSLAHELSLSTPSPCAARSPAPCSILLSSEPYLQPGFLFLRPPPSPRPSAHHPLVDPSPHTLPSGGIAPALTRPGRNRPHTWSLESQSTVGDWLGVLTLLCRPRDRSASSGGAEPG
jgi:hypothetical protein